MKKIILILLLTTSIYGKDLLSFNINSTMTHHSTGIEVGTTTKWANSFEFELRTNGTNINYVSLIKLNNYMSGVSYFGGFFKVGVDVKESVVIGLYYRYSTSKFNFNISAPVYFDRLDKYEIDHRNKFKLGIGVKI